MGRVITNPTGSVVDASEVKILYESNENTNAYTDGDKASLGEVKDAIDMAKKVVEITFLLNDWTSNSDGTYSQTVNNSEIKSSMNPDLISMLSSGATPEEQKAYMKNFSILCQGVGNTADGSVTYKIYKQMTGDITVGLTRLGGVRQIESEAKVDDVKVGGVSVVKNKVAEIPAIPSADDFVPYTGATKDVNLGTHNVIAAEVSSDNYDGSNVGYKLTNNGVRLKLQSTGRSRVAEIGKLTTSINLNDEVGVSGINTTDLEVGRSIVVATKGASVGSYEADAACTVEHSGRLDLGTLAIADPKKDYHAVTRKYFQDNLPFPILETVPLGASNLIPAGEEERTISNISELNIPMASIVGIWMSYKGTPVFSIEGTAIANDDGTLLESYEYRIRNYGTDNAAASDVTLHISYNTE